MEAKLDVNGGKCIPKIYNSVEIRMANCGGSIVVL